MIKTVDSKIEKKTSDSAACFKDDKTSNHFFSVPRL